MAYVVRRPGRSTTWFRQTVLRRATIAQIADFDVVKSHRARAQRDLRGAPLRDGPANVALTNPDGAVYSESASYEGMSVRVLKDYDPNFLRDRSVVSTFTGLASVNDEYLTDANGLVLDVDGNPQITLTKNVRGAKGTFTPA